MKLREKIKAIELRKEGLSYERILQLVGVSKGTLSQWLKDIPLTDKQVVSLKGRAKSRYAGAKANQTRAKSKKEQIFEAARKEAQQLVGKPLFVAGLMLYWAEGTKNGATVAFTNSDPAMVRLMMRWFREICCVPEKKFRILVFIHSLLINDDWQQKWIEVTGVPLSQFNRPHVKPTITKHRKNKLYEGTCVIKINDVALLAKIKGWQRGLVEMLSADV